MQNKNPEVSVIIPVYNDEKYICRCLDSVMEQTFNDYEVIIIDDGSIDKSGEICDAYRMKSEKVVVIHQCNKGLASSRKTGIDYAKGKYVTFIDSDDYVSKNLLQTLYDKIANFDMITCSYTRVIGDKERKVIPFNEEYRDVINNEQMLHMFFMRKYIDGSAWGMLVRRELYFKIDMCEGAVPGEEICTTLQLLQIVNGIRILSEPLYYYWQNTKGISHSGYTDRHRYGLENYIKMCDVLIGKYPKYHVIIAAYFCEYEMAIMTAMIRNSRYEKEVITILQLQLKKHFGELICNKYTAIYYKISATMIILNYKSFAFVFKRIRKIVAR